jgi:hypothetical protein
MIFDGIFRSLENLGGRWADVRDSAQTLVDVLGGTGTPDGAVVDGWRATSEAERVRIDGLRQALPPFPPVANLINAATAIFQTSQQLAYAPVWALAQPFLIARRGLPGAIKGAVEVLWARFQELQKTLSDGLQELLASNANQAFNMNVGGIRSTIDDISTYPLFTQDFSYPSAAPAGISGSPSSLGLDTVVQKALSEVIGLRPRTGDPKSFVNALQQSFSCQEIEGRVECTWMQRSAAGVSELGGSITGAQASIYARSKEAYDSALPLLDGLTALRTEADPQLTEAIRSVIRTEFAELVKEFALEGGPRVSRVDELFDTLIGRIVDPAGNPIFSTSDQANFGVTLQGRNGRILDAANVDLLDAFGRGDIGRLGDAFGLTRNLVNTILEEKTLTDYLIVRDYLDTMFLSYATRFRTSFLRNVDTYLGTQLILLQRTLAVVAESVDEVEFAMNSVFLGPAERKTVRIDFPAPTPPMYVDELLTWVQAFASEEGTQIIVEGGKLGVRSLVPTLRRLRDLVEHSEDRIRHPGARHPRVRRTLIELRTQIDESMRLAQTIQ